MTDASRRLIARTALAAISLLYLALAIVPAVFGTDVVLALAGGSPDWLLGPFRIFGDDVTVGSGPYYYAGLMLASALFAAIVWQADSISLRTLSTVVIGLHALFLLAPPLLSQDVFSYIAYARLGVEHELNPYSYRPFDIPQDPVFGFAGSKDAVNVYGPFFTQLTYPLAWLSVPVAFWVLKVVAAASSLGVVALSAKIAGRVDASVARAVALVGLCPATLVHVVAGAHNEALVMLIVVGGVAYALSDSSGLRERAGGFIAALAIGFKASAAVPLPFMLAAAKRKWQMFTGMFAAGVLALVTALGAFGSDAVGGLSLISSNQDRSSRYSIPHKIVDGLGELFGEVDRAAATDVVRGVLVLLLAVLVVWLLRRSWRQPDTWLANAGWATFGVLIATAWLVPWYLLWLLPFAAVGRDSRLVWATVAFSAYTMLIAIPF